MDIELIDKLWSKTEVNKDTKCWEWQGKRMLTRGRRTYGYFSINRKTVLVHRISLCIYLKLKYSDSSWVACHTCNNQKCWNPLHLYRGTLKDNANDPYKDMTHCKNGHERNKENTYINTQGSKMCKVCAKDYHKIYYRENKGNGYSRSE